MYITTKLKPEGVSNLIDELFEIANIEDIDYVITDNNPLIRTVTHKVTEQQLTTQHTTLEKVLMFCAMVDTVCAKHPHPETEYNQFRIPKRTHGFRTINAPEPQLKEDMKKIANALENYLDIQSHDSAWAYIKGRDVVKAMTEHTANESKWFLKLDLHDFFGSCNPEFIVERLSMLYPFALYLSNEKVKTALNKLAKFATLNNGLPQGTPLSPILTNLIMVPFDYEVTRLIYRLVREGVIPKQKYIYTRYADDIIISSKMKYDYTRLVREINRKLLTDTPLTINKEKTRYGSSSGRNWNLGIMFNSDNKLTIGYRRKQKLKSVIHNYITSTEPWSLEDLRWLLGQLSWLRNVEPEYFEGLMTYFQNKTDVDVWNSIITDIKNHN